MLHLVTLFPTLSVMREKSRILFLCAPDTKYVLSTLCSLLAFPSFFHLYQNKDTHVHRIKVIDRLEKKWKLEEEKNL